MPESPPPSHSILSVSAKDPKAVKNRSMISYFGCFFKSDHFMTREQSSPQITPMATLGGNKVLKGIRMGEIRELQRNIRCQVTGKEREKGRKIKIKRRSNLGTPKSLLTCLTIRL